MYACMFVLCLQATFYVIAFTFFHTRITFDENKIKWKLISCPAEHFVTRKNSVLFYDFILFSKNIICKLKTLDQRKFAFIQNNIINVISTLKSIFSIICYAKTFND